MMKWQFARGSFLITILILALVYVEYVPIGQGMPPTRDLRLFPATMGEWYQLPDESISGFVPLPKADQFMLRMYADQLGEPLSLFIGYWRKYRHKINLFGGKNLSPGKKWTAVKRLERKISAGMDSFDVYQITFKKDRVYLVVSYTYFVGYFGQMSKVWGRTYHSASAMLNIRSDVTFIRLSSLPHPVEENAYYLKHHLEFFESLVPLLSEYLPYEL